MDGVEQRQHMNIQQASLLCHRLSNALLGNRIEDFDDAGEDFESNFKIIGMAHRLKQAGYDPNFPIEECTATSLQLTNEAYYGWEGADEE
jgi:hypothetical protein